MRFLLLLFVSVTLSAVDHTDGIRLSKGIDSSGASTLIVWLDQVSSANWLVGNDATSLSPIRYLFGSGLNVSAADGNGCRTISVNNGGSAPTVSSATRSLNSIFQPSATNGTAVSYNCTIITTSTIAGGQDGEVYLEQADNVGFTTNVVTLDRIRNGQSVSLAIALQIVQPIAASLQAHYVPAGKYLRLRTNNLSGTPSFSFNSGREVTFP